MTTVTAGGGGGGGGGGAVGPAVVTGGGGGGGWEGPLVEDPSKEVEVTSVGAALAFSGGAGGVGRDGSSNSLPC